MLTAMPPASATMPTISAEFVGRLAVRAQEAEELRRLPSATMDDLVGSNFTELLVPARYGGSQADFPAIPDPVRRLAHGCASSAWTIGFFALRRCVDTGHEGPAHRHGVTGANERSLMANDIRDRITNAVQKRVANPLMRRLPIQTLLETTGRKSGEPRRTPLGGSRVGDQFWFVSEFGQKSQYVKNIQANPKVRVRLNGRWHNGTAHLVPDDDPHARLKSLPQLNSFAVRTFGTNLLTIRVDLTD
jgi:deazaflavin-dependent oxidoreductase (nitroreductase family)